MYGKREMAKDKSHLDWAADIPRRKLLIAFAYKRTV